MREDRQSGKVGAGAILALFLAMLLGAQAGSARVVPELEARVSATKAGKASVTTRFGSRCDAEPCDGEFDLPPPPVVHCSWTALCADAPVSISPAPVAATAAPSSYRARAPPIA